MSRPAQPPDLLVLPRYLCHEATDSAAFGELVRLYEVADNAWPNPAPVPRWASPHLLEQLALAGNISLADGDRFTVPSVEWNRTRQSEWHRAGGKARADQAPREGGRFTSSHQQGPAAAGKPPADVDVEVDVEVDVGVAAAAGTHQQAPAAAGDDDDDYLDAWYRLTASVPSPKVTPWLHQLANEHGAARLIAALAAEWSADPDRATVLGRTQARLWSDGRTLEKDREQRRRQEAAAEKARIEEMPLETRQANLARLRSQLVESGLMSQAQADRYVNGDADA